MLNCVLSINLAFCLRRGTKYILNQSRLREKFARSFIGRSEAETIAFKETWQSDTVTFVELSREHQVPGGFPDSWSLHQYELQGNHQMLDYSFHGGNSFQNHLHELPFCNYILVTRHTAFRILLQKQTCVFSPKLHRLVLEPLYKL